MFFFGIWCTIKNNIIVIRLYIVSIIHHHLHPIYHWNYATENYLKKIQVNYKIMLSNAGFMTLCPEYL